MDVDVLKGSAAREVFGHHDHARNPEEDDVVTGNENRRGEVEVVSGLVFAPGFRPAQCGEGHHGGTEPRVKDVLVTGELDAFSGLSLSFFFAFSNVDVALFVVPGRNLMAPPELTADEPVLNVFEPLAVNALPFLREDVHFPRGDGFKAHFSDGLAREETAFGGGFAHRHVPLLGEHGFDHLTGTRHTRHHVLDVLDAHQQALRL